MSSSGAQCFWIVNALVDKDGYKDLSKKKRFLEGFWYDFCLL